MESFTSVNLMVSKMPGNVFDGLFSDAIKTTGYNVANFDVIEVRTEFGILLVIRKGAVRKIILVTGGYFTEPQETMFLYATDRNELLDDKYVEKEVAEEIEGDFEITDYAELSVDEARNFVTSVVNLFLKTPCRCVSVKRVIQEERYVRFEDEYVENTSESRLVIERCGLLNHFLSATNRKDSDDEKAYL